MCSNASASPTNASCAHTTAAASPTCRASSRKLSTSTHDDVRETAKHMFERMDADLVFSDNEVSPGMQAPVRRPARHPLSEDQPALPHMKRTCGPGRVQPEEHRRGEHILRNHQLLQEAPRPRGQRVGGKFRREVTRREAAKRSNARNLPWLRAFFSDSS